MFKRNAFFGSGDRGLGAHANGIAAIGQVQTVLAGIRRPDKDIGMSMMLDIEWDGPVFKAGVMGGNTC